MAKRKITAKQARNIRARHERVLGRRAGAEPDGSSLGPLADGTVISRYGSQADVEDDRDGSVHRCHARRTLPVLTTGDRVLFRANVKEDTDQLGLIEALKPRSSLLCRPDYYDGVKPVAANVGRILIVSAKEPEFSTNIIDRYLVACVHAGIPPLIVVNKIDLFSADEKTGLGEILRVYEKNGWPSVTVSAATGEGVAELGKMIAGETAILAGQSGVGKSSLLNRLMPEARAETGGVSEAGLGRHTTTGSRLYRLPGGAVVIDSPGVREFGLWHLPPGEIVRGYPEIAERAARCRFRDCRHLPGDPGCAVADAVQKSEIAKFRFDNYHRIIESMKENAPAGFAAPGGKTRKQPK